MIAFNQSIDAGNRVKLAAEHVRETVALLDDDGWRQHGRCRGVTSFTRQLEVQDAVSGRQSSVRAVLSRTYVAAPRAEVFDLVSTPTRAKEWDSSDRGFEWVQQFDADDTVFRNFNQPLLRKIDSVLYRVVRADIDPDRSLYCARSVIDAKAPPSEYRRLSQQIFAWAVRDLDAESCELTVLASPPEHMLPAWLQRLAFIPGWRAILTKIRKLYA